MHLPQRFIELCMLDEKQLTDEDISELKRLYQEYTKEFVYETAKKKKVLPYFAHNLLKADCDAEFWQEVHNRYLKRNLKVIDLLDRVFAEFEKAEIKNVCVAENFAAVLSSGACLGCFCSGDVDFYCDDIDLDKLDNIMISMGFEWSDRHKRKKSFAREYKSLDTIGEEFWLNFQFKPMTRKKTHLYDQRYVLRRYHTLFSQTEYYEQTHIKYFAPEAAMYLNCVHISSGHYYILAPGLRLLADIDRPARTRDINWETVCKWAQEDKLGIRSDVVLWLTNTVLKTPISKNAYTKNSETRKFDNLISYLVDSKTNEYRIPKKGIVNYLWFLTKTELMSDGTSMLFALFKRLWVVLVDWN